MHNELIQAAPVERDEDGLWSHPGIPEFDEGQTAEWKAWLAAQGLQLDYKFLEWEEITHPAYIAYFDEESCNCTLWSPQPPAGAGWFTLSIHDTEDGPIWVWARRIQGEQAAEKGGAA